jgi:predicted O-linked N-acetylglucosamine transferase (SPINDLY family)
LPKRGFLLIAQNPIKLLPHRDRVFREISERTGKPLVICDSANGLVGDLVAARMSRAGIRVQKLPFLSDSDFYRVMELADVILDSFDFGGGITTIDALSLGNPPVSCLGEFMRGRLGVPCMRQAGVADMLTESEAAYIDLACDADRIAAARERCDPSPIYGDLRPVRALDDFLLGLR